MHHYIECMGRVNDLEMYIAALLCTHAFNTVYIEEGQCPSTVGGGESFVCLINKTDIRLQV